MHTAEQTDASFKPRRGRPTSKQVAAIEQVIIDVAREEFLTNGYANTSMEAVSSAAGVSKGTLYARYTGKEALFDAVVSDRLAVWRERHPMEMLEAGAGPSEVLFRTGTSFLRRMREPEIASFHRLIMTEAPRFPELANQFYEIGFQGVVSRLAEALEGASAPGQTTLANARSVAQAFMAALIGWLDSESLRRQPSDDDCGSFVSGLVTIFTGGRSAW